MQFRFDRLSSAYSKKYGIGDISVNGKTVSYESIAPAYKTSADFVDSIFNARDSVTPYDGTSQLADKYFMMNGRKYRQGVAFNCYYNTWAQFNVESVKNLSFTLGHVDNTSMYDAKLYIYLDEELVFEEALSPTMALRQFSYDVSKYKVVRFFFDRLDSAYNKTYGIGNISLTANPIQRGDINKDGSVNTTDLDILAKHVMNRNKTVSAGYDLSGDGKVTMKDVVILNKFIYR